jgi:A/G-specific adenine glycosylase
VRPTDGSPKKKATQALRTSLLDWYDAKARDLPWRRSRDPYAIWVSEIMLQQTRVDTVLRYYDRFLERFPTTHALAEASEDAVMAAWSGLGYYRRARMLHAGVREVVARYGGRLPQEPDARRALPGVGRYTAGAIGSIAFGRSEPVVDGNVARVLCRLFGIDTPPAQSSTQKRLWQEAEHLVQGPRPGALNQALMELGATVCSKRSPACRQCPVRSHCAAYAQGRTDELPRAKQKRAPRSVAVLGLLATRQRGDRLELWLDRGEGSLFSGLWNLPMAEGRGREAAQGLLAQSGLRGRLATRAETQLEHVLTHMKLRVQLWRVQDACADGDSALRPFALHELEGLGISKLTHKALSALGLSAQLGLALS